MALISTGFTPQFGGASNTAGPPAGSRWPGGDEPLEDDYLVCAVIGYPEDQEAMDDLVVRSGATDEWDYLVKEILDVPPRPFGLCIAIRKYLPFIGFTFVDTNGSWTSGGYRWTARVGGYRGALDPPDRVQADNDVLPATPYRVPEIDVPRDSGLITIVAQAADDSDMSVFDAGDFVQPTNIGVTTATGGARWALWLHDLEAYPATPVQWPELTVRDTATPTYPGVLIAATFNLPIAVFPPELTAAVFVGGATRVAVAPT